MIMGPIKEALTFDDVTLAPKYSEVLPSEVDTKIQLSKHISLKIPLLSSAMDTVTESKMAIAIAKAGGIGIIHRNLSVTKQIQEIKKVKANKLIVGAAVGAGLNEIIRADAILKEGVILTLNEIQDYERNHPGWDICTIFDDQTDIAREMKKWGQLKRNQNSGFWVPGEDDNKEFQHYVETWLKDWVGWVEESVFDVNVLVLDEHNVCVSNPNNPLVNAFFKKHKIDAVHIPWRHRFFWDGGLHCITLDLERESYGY